jgi:hypothetical protein
MKALFNLDQIELKKMSIKEYFKTVELAIDSALSVDELTDFFSTKPFFESKPYLTRRRLIPKDPRFKKIELVYKDSYKVDAIVWDLTILLSELSDIFGEPIIYNELYSEATAFEFKSNNQRIKVIKTRHPKWLKMLKEKKVFEYQDENNQKLELIDPEFSFIQFNLTNS